MENLREDPSLASETLDHPGGWPQDVATRQWLVRAMRFLGENAPERKFTFHAGWPEQRPTSTTEIELTTFLEIVAAGRMGADELYDVRTRSRTA
jgi:hypothetical protein